MVASRAWLLGVWVGKWGRITYGEIYTGFPEGLLSSCVGGHFLFFEYAALRPQFGHAVVGQREFRQRVSVHAIPAVVSRKHFWEQFLTSGQRVAALGLSKEECLQTHGKGGDGREGMLFESLREVFQCELGRRVGNHLRWRTHACEGRANSNLSVQKSSPDMIGS